MTILDGISDDRLMGFTLALGRRRLGGTWPNPSVGATVVASDGRILAAAATAAGGRPHAEPAALAAAGDGARGAILYVSLEPCSHHGRTPPCAEAIVSSGVSRVVTAIEDADPRVAGRGHAILRRAGIWVVTGIRAEEAAIDHRGHLMRVRHGRPWLTVKLARTSDGYAGQAGSRLLVTGEDANARTHMLRAKADAIMVGVGTVLADDPRLDVRLPGLEQASPVRIVADTRLRIPLASRLVATARQRPTWILCGEDADPDAERRLVREGATVLRLPAPAGSLDLSAAMRRLAEAGLTRVLCEGGPALAEGLAAAGLADDLVLLTGPAALGRPGLPALGPRLAALSAGRRASREMVGRDLLETYERSGRCSQAS